MSKIKTNSIVNRNDDGAVTFTQGATVPVGQIFSVEGGVSITGVCTATSFSGDGSALSNLRVIGAGKVFAYRLILDVLPFQR